LKLEITLAKVRLINLAIEAISADRSNPQRVRELFEAVSEVSADAREAWLSQVCLGDPELRALLDQMVQADHQEHSLLDHPLGLAAGGGSLDTPDLKEGDSVGPYRILRQIGSGGMGVVYLADKGPQRDAEFFAVKILLWSSHDFYQRFLQEQAILSRLRHPNIARLVDSGQTEDRIPYLVMEYVDGQPIHKYCEQANLSAGGCVKLFRQLCAAVIYLHQNLVVHRDLKPGNILVTEDGTAKLLDFGIAKLLPGHQDASSAAKTRAGLMTPDYASPEQIRGGPISTLTDVYALGVLLYELLSGRKPFSEPKAEVHEILRRICEDEPAKPSAAAGRAELRGELDNIVLKAMQKEPSARYASVEQFDADLRSHLDGLPVLAQGNSVFYQAGKFVKRNRASVAAAAIVLISLCAGVIATTMQAGIARRERARAEAQRERANAERRLTQLQKVAQGAVEVYRSADQNSVPKNTKALIAENVRDALLALRGETTLEPRFGPVLDSVSAEVRGYQAADAAAWRVPRGWSALQTEPGQYRVRLDPQVLYQHKPTLSLNSLVAEPVGMVYVTQEFDAVRFRGARVRLTGFLRTARVATQASLGLVATGGEMDASHSSSITVSGTKSWQKHDVVMDIPDTAGIIRIVVALMGTGSAWAANLGFERVSSQTPLTSPRRPQNLSFTAK
jgi:hypothetical protein